MPLHLVPGRILSRSKKIVLKLRSRLQASLRVRFELPHAYMRPAAMELFITVWALPSTVKAPTAVMALANLAMATANIGKSGVGVNPLRGQNDVQGSCDMGSFPHELTGYRHISDGPTRSSFETAWGTSLDPEPGLRIPNMLDAAVEGTFKGLYVQGEDIAQSDPDTKHVLAGLKAMECVVVQDLFLNETANFATYSCRVRPFSKRMGLSRTLNVGLVECGRSCLRVVV